MRTISVVYKINSDAFAVLGLILCSKKQLFFTFAKCERAHTTYMPFGGQKVSWTKKKNKYNLLRSLLELLCRLANWNSLWQRERERARRTGHHLLCTHSGEGTERMPPSLAGQGPLRGHDHSHTILTRISRCVLASTGHRHTHTTRKHADYNFKSYTQDPLPLRQSLAIELSINNVFFFFLTILFPPCLFCVHFFFCFYSLRGEVESQL